MTLRRIFNWIVGLPVAVLVIVFAVANRQWIVVSLDPLHRDQPLVAINMPLWALFFCGLFVGLLAGWIAAWLAQGKWRKAAREARIEAVKAHQEHERLKRVADTRAVLHSQDTGT